MTVTIADLNNAKLDVDHIAAISNSQLLTATDRLGNTKDTIAGAMYKISAFNDRGPWVTARLYAVKDLVSNGGTWYVCVSAHTSGATFAGDVATKWRVYQGVLAGDLAAPGGAALSGYLPAGTGAVPTTVAEELNLLPIKPEQFGAVGSGAADDTAAVQKAINKWALNRSREIYLARNYRIDGTLEVSNLETDNPETRLKFVGGGTLIKNNAGFMFDRPAGQVLQTGHIYFHGTRFEGAGLNGQTFILNGDHIIRTHFIGCFGTKINIAKAAGYLQTIYCTAGTTWREWGGYLFDCNYLFDVKWDGIAEAGDAFLITRDATADPACNSLKVSGNIEGLSGASGPAIKAGICFASSVSDLYCEQNAGGDLDFNGGNGFHKGLTIKNCGFQPTAAQKADPNYYPVITGKGAEDALTLIGNASTHNLFDVTAGNQSAVLDSGNYAPAGKKKFSPTSPRLFKVQATKFIAALLPGFGANIDSYYGSFGFEANSGTVDGEVVTGSIQTGSANPQVSPGSYVQTKFRKGTVVFHSSPVIAARSFGGTNRNCLILGWVCMADGAPGTWQEIAVMLPY